MPPRGRCSRARLQGGSWSAILNNGALYDADVRSLQSYPRKRPPRHAGVGAWGEPTNIPLPHGVLSVVYQWIRASTPDHVGGAYIVVRQPLHCSLMLFKCLQHVVYTVIFKNPWLYVLSDTARRGSFSEIWRMQQRPLWCWHMSNF
jgi:hypothetical protein